MNATVTVLLVARRATLLPVLQSWFAGLGITVIQVASGEEALPWMLDLDVVAVVLDVPATGVSGVDLVRALRAHSPSAVPPLLFLLSGQPTSGQPTRFSLQQVDPLGMDDPQVVPILAGALRARVHLLADDHRQAREAAQERARDTGFRAMVDAAPAMLRVTDPAARCLLLSSGWCEFTGQTQAQAAEWLGGVHVDERGRIEQAILEAHEHRTTLALDYRLRRADGVFRWVRDTTQPRLGPDGEFLGSVSSLVDITEQRHAEESLRLLDALGQETRQVSDPAAVMVITTRLLGEHLAAIRCTYADLDDASRELTIRHNWTAPGVASVTGVYPVSRFGPRVADDLRAGRSLVVRDVDRELPPGQGAAMFEALGVKAIVCCPLVRQGHIVAMMAVHQGVPRAWSTEEISLIEQVADRSWAHIERTLATAALREQDRHKDEFLATLAHELRNPLAPIRTGLELLQQVPADDPAAVKARAIIGRQLGHMVRLLDDLLDVSRTIGGTLAIERERVALQTVIEHALEASQPVILSAGHTLTLHVPGEPIWLEGDLTRLAQVLTNVLHNAARYTPHGGRIELTAGTEQGEVVVQVTDSGTGIAAEMLTRVFDPFTQGNRTLHRAQGGLGIGLSLARKLLELHGGTITAQSAGPGQGSTFTLRLPRAASLSSRSQARIDAPAVAVPAHAPSRRILVVDDNEDGADMLAEMLHRRGHETRIAYDGERALEAVEEFSPEVIFLDLGLPGIDGHEVARRLRADERWARVVLVALTGWGSDADKEHSKAVGIDVHLTKPVDATALEGVLARFTPPEHGAR